MKSTKRLFDYNLLLIFTLGFVVKLCTFSTLAIKLMPLQVIASSFGSALFPFLPAWLGALYKKDRRLGFIIVAWIFFLIATVGTFRTSI